MEWYAGSSLNRKSDISIRNGVLLYKQLLRPMMDYVFPAWRSAARTQVRRLQVSSPCCVCPLVHNKQADTRGSRCSTVCCSHQHPGCELYSKVVDEGNPVVRQLGRYLR
jgi:hypothetical protein